MWVFFAQADVANGDERSFWINILAAFVYAIAIGCLWGLWWLIRLAYRSQSIDVRIRWLLMIFLTVSLIVYCFGGLLVVLVRVDESFALRWNVLESLVASGQSILAGVNVCLDWLNSSALPPPPWWLIILVFLGVSVWFIVSWSKRISQTPDQREMESAVTDNSGNVLAKEMPVSSATTIVEGPPATPGVEWRGIKWIPGGSRGWIPLCPREVCGAKMAIRPAVTERPGIVIKRPGPINVFVECQKCKYQTQLNMTNEQVMKAVTEAAEKLKSS